MSLGDAGDTLRAITEQLTHAEQEERPPVVVLNGVLYQVALDEQGQVADWFMAGRWPKYLGEFDGRIVGYYSPSGLGCLSVKQTQYSLERADDVIVAAQVAMKRGIPSEFLLWGESEARYRVPAVEIAALGEAGQARWQRVDEDVSALEMADPGTSVETLGEQQVLADTVWSTLLRRYEREEVELIVRLLAEWYDLTRNDGDPEEIAYAHIRENFGIAPAQLNRYMIEVRTLLREASLGAMGFEDDA
jgi:hypothetical protein